MRHLTRTLLTASAVFFPIGGLSGDVHWDNSTVVESGRVWTDDLNAVNGWRVEAGEIVQGAANEDSMPGGDRVLALPNADLSQSLQDLGSATIKTDLAFGNYVGNNGMWAGLLLFVNEEEPSPSGSVAVILERADAEGIHGGLRIHYPGGMSELAPFGRLRHHGYTAESMTSAPTLEDLHWVELSIHVSIVDDHYEISASAVPLWRMLTDSTPATARVIIPRDHLSGDGIALGTSAQYGFGVNPVAWFDDISVRQGIHPATELGARYRDAAPHMVATYLDQGALGFLDGWPEYFDTTDETAQRYFELNRRLYQLRRVLGGEVISPELAEAEVRVHTFMGGMEYVRRALLSVETDEEVIDARLERASRLHELYRHRLMNGGAHFWDEVHRFTNDYPEDDAVYTLQVAALHQIASDDSKSADYWTLVEHLRGRLEPGALRDRMEYDAVVKLTREEKFEEAASLAQTMLVESPNSEYAPLFLESVVGGYYQARNFGHLAILAEELQRGFPESSWEYYEGMKAEALVTYFQNNDHEGAFALFTRMMQLTPPRHAHRDPIAESADWAAYIAMENDWEDRLTIVLAALVGEDSSPRAEMVFQKYGGRR